MSTHGLDKKTFDKKTFDKKTGTPMKIFAFALLVSALAWSVPAAAQSPGNPFAGRQAGGNGPYGSDAGAMVHMMQRSQFTGQSGSAAFAEGGGGGPGVVETDGKLRAPRGDGRADIWQAIFVSCVGGAYLGGLTSAMTTTVVSTAGGGLGLPLLAGAIGTAAGIGCGIGASTAAVSLGAAAFWQGLSRAEP